MFKKFKDKLAEEMKQSPARLQASVQQLAQAVVSPAPSNSSIQEVSASNDNFSLTEGGDETPKNTPVKHSSFHNVDLMSPSPNRTEISRRSSVSSVISDASSLFPMYESPQNLYHLQSDMDQSASEVDDNISPHLDRVTKDQLYSAYRKAQAKYHKYRGRYTDLAAHYRELDRVKIRLESVLVETQDKVLRRISDLKEQCQLEQQAKAHLEEVLRNDIEEKDHIINTLNTKVKLLQVTGPLAENSTSEGIGQKGGAKVNLIDLTNEPSNDEDNALSAENAQLKDKLKKLENLVLRYKESLRRNKENFTEVMKEKDILEVDHKALKNSTAERISAMDDELNKARVKIDKLTDEIDILHRREEESAISLAENKLSVHRELEEKEEQIKQLRIDLKHTTEDREKLNQALTSYKSEFGNLKSLHVDSNMATEYEDKTTRDATSKEDIDVEIKQQHHREINHNNETRSSDKDENTTLENDCRELRYKLDDLEKENLEYKHDREALQSELLIYKNTYIELKNEYDAHKIVTEEKRKSSDATIEELQATVRSADKELENMKSALIDRDQMCEDYNKKIQQYSAMLEKAKHKLCEQEIEMRSFKDKLEEKMEQLTKMGEELASKKMELSTVQSELELGKSIMDDLKNKAQTDSSTISFLRKEMSDLTNRLVYYNDCIRRLKQDSLDIKSIVKNEFSNRRTEISNLNAILARNFVKFQEEDITLKSNVDELRTKITNLEQYTSKETEEELARLRSELARAANVKIALEAELRNNNVQLKEMTLIKCNQYDELNVVNNKLIAEIDNLHFKIHDLQEEAPPRKLTRLQQEVSILRERIKALENVESINRSLSIEIDDLKEKYTQASRAFEEVNELKERLREATGMIGSLESESTSNRDMLTEQLRISKSEIARLEGNLIEKENGIKILDAKVTSEKEHVTHLKSTCDSHIQTIEEHVRKYLNLEAEYQATRESHAKEIAGLMENNKVLQETINVKLVQLKKMKIVKERQSKMMEQTRIELEQLQIKHVELSRTLEDCEKQIETLRLENSKLAEIIIENENLKDKRNDLLNRNRKLCDNEAILKRKIGDYEKEIEELQKRMKDCVESYKSQLDNRSEETERLTVADAQLVRKSAKIDSLREKLATNERELQVMKGKLDQRNIELDKIVKNENIMRKENDRLVAELKSLTDQVVQIKNAESKNTHLSTELNDLSQRNSDTETLRLENDQLIAERTILRDRIAELECVNSANKDLQIYVDDLRSKISSLEAIQIANDRSHESDALQSTENSSMELSALKDLLAEREAEVKLLEDRNSNMSQEIGNLKHFSLQVDEGRREMIILKNSLALSEEKIVGLNSEIDSLVRTNDALRKELEIIGNNTDTKGQLDNDDKLHEENKRLEMQLDETLITFQAKEMQMQLANNESKAQINHLREQLKINEEEQGMRLKQLVKEFQAQLHDKEEELQAALEKRFDRQHNYESNLMQQYKEQLKDCQIELTERSEQLESLVLEKKDAVAEKGKDIDRLVETIAQIKKEHANEIKELEKKWKAIVQQKIDNLQAKHEEELNELTKEWQNERKSDAQIDAVFREELESTSRVAMAAVQTSTGSIHTLQQTLTSQRRELAELRKLVNLRQDTLEDSTEIEYLRNILFEYMMGRETMVLARVIAAVVKFDQEQTMKILKKEEDKLTLFGSLGLT